MVECVVGVAGRTRKWKKQGVSSALPGERYREEERGQQNRASVIFFDLLALGWRVSVLPCCRHGKQNVTDGLSLTEMACGDRAEGTKNGPTV